MILPGHIKEKDTDCGEPEGSPTYGNTIFGAEYIKLKNFCSTLGKLSILPLTAVKIKL